jgi:MoxR-like ATPase
MSMEPTYRSFLPRQLHDLDPGYTLHGSTVPTVRDRRDGAVYLLDDEARLAVDVALATSRPLLLRGEPGSGKSSLAAYVARNLGWRYYEHVVSSRTQARDVLWTFDSVRKLADASAANSDATRLLDNNYVEPGVLWWAMDPESAQRRGQPVTTHKGATRPVDEPNAEVNLGRKRSHAVVLMDEIDKADPDVPNGLLVPLGSAEFRVSEIGIVVRSQPALEDGLASPLLTVLTTNEERELPPAFLRRCIAHTLKPPSRQRLVEIGQRHIASSHFLAERINDRLLEELADVVIALRQEAMSRATRPPSTAEYLDAAWACASLSVTVSDPDWHRVQRLVLDKDNIQGSAS